MADEAGVKILIVDDEPNIRTGLAKGLEKHAAVIDTAAEGAVGLKAFESKKHDLVITDLRLPGEVDGLEVVRRVHDQRPETTIIVITAYGTVETAVEAMRLGAYDFVTKPVDLDLIRLQVQKAAEHRRLVTENRELRGRLAQFGEMPEIIGNSQATQQVLHQIRQVASTDATVLILGESGTGKELTARAIHRLSNRSEEPFVTVNLGALPDTLLESELFGHEKGAFTGADRRKIGRLEAAGDGTIFLDEVTETSVKSQVDLLRVLEQREFQRLGGSESLPMRARVISATNKDIQELIREDRFREDLYYRLNVVPIELPPLRERRDDLPLLIEHFSKQMAQRHDKPPKRFASDAMRLMMQFPWPGNIRQLRNLIERLMITVEGPIIHAEDLPQETSDERGAATETLAGVVEVAEKQAILAALAACDYHRERTAKLLDISVRTLHYKMNRYGLH